MLFGKPFSPFMLWLSISLVLLVITLAVNGEKLETSKLTEEVDVFISKTGGYYCYKIPVLFETFNGTLIAYSEARKGKCMDWDPTDVVQRRSFDGGRTWHPPVHERPQLVVGGVYKDHNVAGNLAPLQNDKTGTIVLPFNFGNVEPWVTYSNDNGASYSQPVQYGDSSMSSFWTWIGFGPPSGLQLRDPESPAKGRLLVPAYASSSPFYDNGLLSSVYMLYSDDGLSWKKTKFIANGRFPSIPFISFFVSLFQGILGNECQVIELKGGDLLVNSRTIFGHRIEARSQDGGLTWTPFEPVKELPSPLVGCEGSIVAPEGGSKLFYTGPNSLPSDGALRKNMSVWEVADSATKTPSWKYMKRIREGPCGYSSLRELRDGRIVVLYEWSANATILFIPDAISLNVITTVDNTNRKSICDKAQRPSGDWVNSTEWQTEFLHTQRNFWTDGRFYFLLISTIVSAILALCLFFLRCCRCCSCSITLRSVGSCLLLAFSIIFFLCGVIGLALMFAFRGDDPKRYSRQGLCSIAFFLSSAVLSFLRYRLSKHSQKTYQPLHDVEETKGENYDGSPLVQMP